MAIQDLQSEVSKKPNHQHFPEDLCDFRAVELAYTDTLYDNTS